MWSFLIASIFISLSCYAENNFSHQQFLNLPDKKLKENKVAKGGFSESSSRIEEQVEEQVNEQEEAYEPPK